MLESRAYDKPNDDGFPPDPVVILVATGSYDVGRLVYVLSGGTATVGQGEIADRIRRQVARHNAGRAALRLLAEHGGPDFTDHTGQAYVDFFGAGETVPALMCPLCNNPMTMLEAEKELTSILTEVDAHRCEDFAVGEETEGQE